MSRCVIIGGFPWARVQSAYDDDFVTAIKKKCPLRSYDKQEHVWWIPNGMIETVAKLGKHYFSGVDVSDVSPVSVVAASVIDESDPYNVLCVARHAPAEVIRAAYHTLAKMVHPDNGGDLEHMKTLNVAYDAIKKERGL